VGCRYQSQRARLDPGFIGPHVGIYRICNLMYNFFLSTNMLQNAFALIGPRPFAVLSMTAAMQYGSIPRFSNAVFGAVQRGEDVQR